MGGVWGRLDLSWFRGSDDGGGFPSSGTRGISSSMARIWVGSGSVVWIKCLSRSSARLVVFLFKEVVGCKGFEVISASEVLSSRLVRIGWYRIIRE